jgi:hypothetical protein
MADHGLVNGKSNVYDGVCNHGEGTMKTDDHWVTLAKGILRAEMARRSITYEKLSEKLAEMGVQDSAVNLRNKVARGGFSAAFLLQCLAALGCSTVRLEDA